MSSSDSFSVSSNMYNIVQLLDSSLVLTGVLLKYRTECGTSIDTA